MTTIPERPASRILVVEDNPLTRKMLRITLETDGYVVIEAADGRAALAAVEREMPQLVLQDLILPDMNGFELVRLLRALEGGQATPILALSGFTNRVEEARGVESGFTALLVKPIEPTRLLEVIRSYLPGHEAQSRSGAGRRVLVVDDDPVQLKLTSLHLNQLGFEVVEAPSSAEALRLARARPPDAVFSDVLMPDQDGFQLCFEMRRDPRLRSIPVLLASAWYETDADRQLAERVGAVGLVRKTPDLKEAVEALLHATAPVRVAANVDVQLEHAEAVVRQLERQVTVAADLARRCTLQAAQISLLSGVADALALNTEADAALRDILAATLDAAGISKGALYLNDERGGLVLRHSIGFSPSQRAHLDGFFGHFGALEDAIRRQSTVSIPSAIFPHEVGQGLLQQADVASAQLVPLIADGRGVGAMVLCAKPADVTNEDSIAFARAMGNQLAQSLELASSFARLTASERRYRAVTETAHDAISILAPDGLISEVNPSFEVMLGLPRDQIVGRNINDFAAKGHERANREAFSARLDAASQGHSELSLSKADGSVALVEFSNRLVVLGGEKLIVSIGRDVTERVKTQAHLMFSDRMASIGALAAGVAHEINNPLTATIANLEFALEELAAWAGRGGPAELASLQELLTDADEAAQRVSTIVRDLKVFSRAEEDNRGAVDVQRVLESTLRMARNEIRHRAVLTREYADVPPVQANESRLGQVFLNLVVNAAQAMPDGYANQNQIRVRTRMDASGRVAIEIEDTGSGIPPELLPRMFTPFFTTKPRGVGTGLGLSICQRIVTSFGGEIAVESVVGRGTTFRVLLLTTIFEEAVPAVVTERAVTAPRRGQILVVDDDDMTATAVKRSLSAEHDVAMLDDATTALSRIAAGERFDVIICDLMMPVKTGVEFFAELFAQDPAHAERVIFLTGGAFTVKAREFLDRVPNARLEKPFEMQALRALVNERLL